MDVSVLSSVLTVAVIIPVYLPYYPHQRGGILIIAFKPQTPQILQRPKLQLASTVAASVTKAKHRDLH